MPNVLLQRADGTAKVRKLSGRFTPVMIDSDEGWVRTYRLVEAGQDGQGAFYVYAEDETLRLPVTTPSEEAQSHDGKADGESPEARALGDADPAALPGPVDRGDAGSGEV